MCTPHCRAWAGNRLRTRSPLCPLQPESRQDDRHQGLWTNGDTDTVWIYNHTMYGFGLSHCIPISRTAKHVVHGRQCPNACSSFSFKRRNSPGCACYAASPYTSHLQLLSVSRLPGLMSNARLYVAIAVLVRHDNEVYSTVLDYRSYTRTWALQTKKHLELFFEDRCLQ